MKKIERLSVPTSYGINVDVNGVLLAVYLEPASQALTKLYYGQNRLFTIVEGAINAHLIAEYCIIPEYDELLADFEQDKYEALIY